MKCPKCKEELTDLLPDWKERGYICQACKYFWDPRSGRGTFLAQDRNADANTGPKDGWIARLRRRWPIALGTCLVVLAGVIVVCATLARRVDTWFPTEKGYRWQLYGPWIDESDKVGFQISHVNKQGGWTWLTLEPWTERGEWPEGVLEELPLPAKVAEGNGKVKINFLLSADGYPHAKLDLPLTILDASDVDHGWHWRGGLILIDPNDEIAPEAYVEAEIVVRDEGSGIAEIDKMTIEDCRIVTVDVSGYAPAFGERIGLQYRIFLVRGQGIVMFEMRPAGYPFRGADCAHVLLPFKR